MKLVYLLLCIFVAYARRHPEISATKLDGQVHEFVWCGSNNEVILLRTENNTVYRSDDQGRSYTRITNAMQKSAEETVNDSEEIGEVTNILKSPANDKLLVFIGTKGVMWVSTNCGESMTALNKKFRISRIKLHPVERKWMLASSLQKCKNEDNCIKGAYSLYLTQDLGKHWKKIAENVVHFEWPFNDFQISSGIPASRIYALIVGKNRIHLVKTDDFFGNVTVLVKGATEFMLRTTYLFAVQRGKDATEAVLLVASLVDKFDKFTPAEFPLGPLKPHSFHILDTSENVAFVLVTDSVTAPFGDLYVSDSTGTKFALSLKNCIRDSVHGADFMKIAGLEGIYVANALSEKAAEEYERQKEEEENEEEEWEEEEREDTSMRRSGEGGKRKKLTTLLVLNNIQTFITFNKGGSWRYLKPPTTDYKDRPLHCSGDETCSLHLFIKKATTVPLYSHKNAHGIILANGNVGRALYTESFSRNVYLSRDGGLTWNEIAKGPHVYDLADHGGIFALTHLESDGSLSFKYSWNEAISWERVKVSSKNGSIIDIFTEPDSASQHFLAHVEYYKHDLEDGYIKRYTSMFSINFDNLHERRCKGEDNPGTPESDYEIWSPYDGRHGDKCLMGRKISYVRRKRESECYNGVKFERPISVENCECTEEDYECDFGFARKDQLSNSPCIPLINISYTPPSTCSFGGTYTISSGYRKVPGNTCQGGISHDPIVLSCSYSMMTGSGWVTLALLVVVGLLLVVVIYLFNRASGGKKKPSNKTRTDYFTNVKYGKVGEKVEEPDEELIIQTVPN